jgi:uncharacterized membrane protein YedE/YeeE
VPFGGSSRLGRSYVGSVVRRLVLSGHWPVRGPALRPVGRNRFFTSLDAVRRPVDAVVGAVFVALGLRLAAGQPRC